MSTQPILAQMPQIQDYPTRRTFELVAAALQQIISALGQNPSQGTSGPLTAAQIAQVKAALEASGTHPLQLVGLTQGALTSFTKAANEWLDSFNAATGTFTGSQPSAANLSNGTTGSGAVVLANAPTFTANPTFASVTGTGAVVEATSPSLTTPNVGDATGATLKLTAATPATAAGQVGIGTSQGFGAGAAGTAVTTTTKGAGTGPTTAETIVNYLKVTIAGADYYIPLMQ